jgi:branched-chain amino acid transport system substrate-binding protein
MKMGSKRKMRAGSVAAACALMVLSGCGEGGSGGSEDTFVIGGFGALSGPVAGWGEGQRNGAELAVETINESGDLDVKLELKFEDDACDPAGAQAVFRRLVDREAVDMLYGSSCSASALAMAEQAEADGVVYLSPTATTREMAVPAREFVFSTQVDATTEAEELVRMALESYSPKTVGFMYNSNDYGIAAVASAKKALEDQAPDVKIAPDAGFPEGTSEFDSGRRCRQRPRPDDPRVAPAGHRCRAGRFLVALHDRDHPYGGRTAR